MEKTVKVGMMPGRINEFVIEVGSSIGDVLRLAELNPAGYDVKIDGNKVEDFESAKITSTTNLILLARQVKGNAEKTVKVGMMPGRINEFVVETGTSIADLLAMAELNPTGYDVKVDGAKIEDFSTPVTPTTNLVLLAKQVKGNRKEI